MYIRLRYICVACALSAVAVFSTPALSHSADDAGVRVEDSLQRYSRALFGFGNPVTESAEYPEVMCMQDVPTSEAGFNTGTMPVVTLFVIGNPHLRMPDNLAFQPHTGILYVLMDATTSAEDPAFTNDDVWAST